MSFGYSIGDGILLVQLAWKTLQGARQACGEHDELTREVASLHKVLQRLHKELSNPHSLLNRADDDHRQELNEHGEGCEQILNIMNSIVTKYNKLSESGRSAKRIWQKVKFGNGEMKDLSEIRLKLSAHTSAIIMSLNLCSLGSQGRVEKQLNDVGGDLEGIRGKINWIAANMTASTGDGTVWTSYENDDRSFWRQLRHELVEEGYDSSVLHKHKGLLKGYVEELGRRGVFDQIDSGEDEAPEEDEEPEVELLQDDGQESMESEEEESDIFELEESEPEDFDPLPLSDEPEQSAKRVGPENLDVDQLSLHATLMQSPDTRGPETSVLPISPIEPSLELPSPADELQSDPVAPLSQPEIMAVPTHEYVKKPPMLGRSVHMEDGLDEDFVVDTHPNCFTDRTSETPGENIQNVSSQGSVTSQTSPDIMNSRSHQGPGILSENTTKDFILLSSVPSETSSTPVIDEMIKLSTDSKTLNQKFRRRKQSGKEAKVLLYDRRITFKDPAGRTWIFPFSRVKTWADVTRLITRAFPEVEILSISAPHSHFDLIGPDGSLILPETWYDLVQPGWSVSLQRRSQPQNLDEQPQSPSSVDPAQHRYAIISSPIPLPPTPKVSTYPLAAVPSSRKDPYDDSRYQSVYQNAQGAPEARSSTYEAWENIRGANMAVPGAPTTWNPRKPLSKGMLKSSQGLDARKSAHEAWENSRAGETKIRNSTKPPPKDSPKEYAYRASYGDSDEDEYEDEDVLVGGVISRVPARRPAQRSYESTTGQKQTSTRGADRLQEEESKEDVERVRQTWAKRATHGEKKKSRDKERRYRLWGRDERSVKDDSGDEYRSQSSEKRSKQPKTEEIRMQPTRAEAAARSSPPPLPRAQTFQARDRGLGRGSRSKKTVECSSDDSDSNSSVQGSYHVYDSNAPSSRRARPREPYVIEPPSPPPVGGMGGMGGMPPGLPGLFAAMLNPANACSNDAVYSQEALGKIISTLMEQPPAPKKPTFQSHSSAPPIISSSPRRKPPTRSKTQDYPRPDNGETPRARDRRRKELGARTDRQASKSSDRLPVLSEEDAEGTTPPVRNDQNTYAGKYMQDASRNSDLGGEGATFSSPESIIMSEFLRGVAGMEHDVATPLREKRPDLADFAARYMQAASRKDDLGGEGAIISEFFRVVAGMKGDEATPLPEGQAEHKDFAAPNTRKPRDEKF